MKNSLFMDNSGVEQGGAIYYDYYCPSEQSVSFANNSAPYGPDYASYPVRIGTLNGNIVDKITINDVGSGIPLESPLSLALFDQNNQVYILDSTSQLKLDLLNISDGNISGINQAVMNRGQATFDSFSAVVDPGAESIKMEVSSTLLDDIKLSEIFTQTDFSQKVEMSFRY